MKKLTYLAAVSVVIIAQAASAQVAPASEPLPAPATAASGVQKPGAVKNANVTLKSVDARKVTLPDGQVWELDGASGVVISYRGNGTSLSLLKPGMICVLNGTRTVKRNIISIGLECK